MTENSDGAISLEEAVERMTAKAGADDETVEVEEAEGTGDSEPEAEEIEAEAETETQEEEPEYEVDTGQGKRRVKLSELLESPMLKADYTRKTQTLAEERRAAEKAAAEVAQLREQLSESLQRWAVPTEQEPNWADLAQKLPPQEFNLRKVQWEQRQRQKEIARAEYHAMQERLKAETLASEREKLFEAIPDWRDEAKFLGAVRKMAEDATFYGFQPDELAGISDHRMIRVLNDAIAYRELQKAKPAIAKKVAEAKPALKPGSKPDKARETDAERQKQRAKLKQTGSIADAVSLILQR